MLSCSLKDLLRVELNDEGLEQLAWKDLGKGLSLARLARLGARELVLYRIAAGADPEVFLRHEHLGGEVYWVLRGGIEDETGRYIEGDMVYLDPGSVHAPRAIGETVVLVLWPGGVRIVD